MTTESAKSPAISPPEESDHQPLPQFTVNSDPISPVPPYTKEVWMETYVSSNGIVTDMDTEDVKEPSYYKYLDSKEYADKFKRYEAELKQYLMAQYFSGKDPNGVDIFADTTIIDGETIMSSKWPCTHFYENPDVSYEEPVQRLIEEEEERADSAQAEISPGQISNGGIVSEKNSS